MIDPLSYSIIQTRDPEAISACARIMAATSPWNRYQMDYDQCLKAFEGDFREVYIARSADGIEGFAILQIWGTFKGYIQTLCVREDRRGKGLGTLLLQFCEERIAKISPNIFICVSDFNSDAARLYYAYGFSLIGEIPDFLRPGINELLLRKTTGPILGYEPPV